MSGVPELPEVEALVRFLDERTRDLEILSCELFSIAALKTFDPPLDSIVGHRIVGWSRRGKYLCCDTGATWMVMHLARAGWVRWREHPAAVGQKGPSAGRRGRGPLALSVGLEGGVGFDVTEMGTQKRLAIWAVSDPSQIEGIATLGIDPLDPSFTVDRLAKDSLRRVGDGEDGPRSTVGDRRHRQRILRRSAARRAALSVQAGLTTEPRGVGAPPRCRGERRKRSRGPSCGIACVGAEGRQEAFDASSRSHR